MQTFVALIIFGVSSLAHADCFMPTLPPKEKVQILKTWKAKHVNKFYSNLSGCLLTARLPNKSEITAYTAYEFICALKESETIEISRRQDCCDTGEQGDFTCGIKPATLWPSFRQINTLIFPANPDKRAIPDLLSFLKEGGLNAQNVGDRLYAIYKVPELKADVEKQIPELRKYLTIGDEYTRSAVANLLKKIDPAAKTDVATTISVLGDVRYQLSAAQHNAIVELSQHPDSGKKIVPALLAALSKVDKTEDRELIQTVLAIFKSELKPYLKQLPKGPFWNYLVCNAIAVEKGVDAHRVIWGGYTKEAADCPADAPRLAPLETKEDPMPEKNIIRSWKYSLSKNQWTRLPNTDAPTFYEFGGSPEAWDAVAVESKLFVWGGRKVYSTPSSDKKTQSIDGGASKIEAIQPPHTFLASGGVMNLTTGQWEKIEQKDMPKGRDGFQMLLRGRDIAIFGGNLGAVKQEHGAIYDFSKNQWTPISSDLQAQTESLATWIGDKLWALAGYKQGGIYTPTKKAWDQFTPTEKIASLKTAHWNGSEVIFVYEEIDPSYMNTTCKTSLYDIHTKTSKHLADVGLDCRTLRFAWSGTHLFAWDRNAQTVLDIAQKKWILLPPLPETIKMKGPLILAKDSKFVAWPAGIFDVQTKKWELFPYENAPEETVGAEGALVGSQLFVFGGTAGYAETANNTGGIYDLKTKKWKKLSLKGAPSLHVYVSTPKVFAVGNEVVLIDAGSSRRW